ncbi:MAG: DUF805 domain-containing protein [Hyphomicrobiaceae bacterium]|nr:DUF805 domain-containing protein [Hyphomicrobiaceae bacterium]
MDNLHDLFLTTQGRIARRQFWLGIVVLGVAAVIMGFIFAALFGVPMFNAVATGPGSDGGMPFDNEAILGALRTSGWVTLIITLIFAFPTAALMIKRRHDRGRSGREVWAYLVIGLLIQLYLVQALAFNLQMTADGGLYMPMPSVINVVVGLAGLCLGLYLLVVCGFLKGSAGENSYGPDPHKVR